MDGLNTRAARSMITIGVVYFRTTTLDHLDAAWFTVAQQDFTGVGSVVVLDNNTEDDPRAIVEVLDRYPIPVPRILQFSKHGNPRRTQSWSVNEVARLTPTDWLFLTRSDFLLSPDCLATLAARRQANLDAGFLTSYCHQMGYDATLSNTDALARHSQRDAPWRLDPRGAGSLVGQEPAFYFHETHVDAGVWLTRRRYFGEIGGLDERMVSWGYQQQVWQRRLVAHGVIVDQTPEYLFHHQHHWAPRHPGVAAAEYVGG